MKTIFSKGDKKSFIKTVELVDVARFDEGTIHDVYSTFALARDAEWVCRLFVLEMKEEDEEGIGTLLEIRHHSPAFPGQSVEFTAEVEAINGNEIICKFVAQVGKRLIAEGRQGQKILKKGKITSIFSKLRDC